MTTAANALLVALNAGGCAGEPLVCVHPVSGSPYGYARLAYEFDGWRSVIGIEAPGFDTEREPISVLGELVDEYLQALPPTPGLHLLGWSMGGVIAFEMAQRLSAVGHPVGSLTLVDTALPDPSQPLASESAILERFLCDLTAEFGMPTLPAGAPADLAGPANQADFEAAVLDAGLPEEFCEVTFKKRYDVFRAHVIAWAEHRIQPGLTVRMTHIRAGESPADRMNWSAVARQVDYHVLPGTHYSIWHGAGLLELATIVRARMTDRADG